jgi:hypothetical protein
MFFKSRGGLGGAVHGNRRGSEPEAQSGTGKAVIEGVSQGLCSVVFLFSETALEEPFRMAEGG